MQKTIRIISYGTLAFMLAAAIYAGVIGIHYWTGIGV